jgi:hypothetical protein
MHVGYMMQPHAGINQTTSARNAVKVGASFPGFRPCSTVEQETRLAFCNVCEKNDGGRCALCRTCGGRSIVSKVRLNVESCPLGKWGKLPSFD